MGFKRNIIIGKVGGNANENSVNYKISLPAKMVKDLGVTKENKGVILTFENDSIVIRKDKQKKIPYRPRKAQDIFKQMET